jgi:hypothetical protein
MLLADVRWSDDCWRQTMKTRSGVPESRAFGPAMSSETQWLVTPRKAPLEWLMKNEGAYQLESSGPTAYAACARLGMSLGEVVDIRPATKGTT